MDLAVFLDRDGTINEQMGYLNHLDRFVLLPGVAEAIRRINASGLKAVVVTNQSGASRGYFPMELIDKVHQKMCRLLEDQGAFLDGIYTCPHAPPREGEGGGCECRKPGIGLMLQAARELELDLKRSYVVGDRFTDVETARNAGAKAVLVLTGYGRGELEFLGPGSKIQPDFIAENLSEAVDWILADVRGNPQSESKPRRPQSTQRSSRESIEVLNRISDKIIGLAIEVHRGLGPGLLESVYQQCLAYEFSKQGLKFSTE